MPAQQDPLFQPFTLGDLELPNRVLMAPLTRSRAAQPGDVPVAMNAEYYRQRASAGLIISEATQVSPPGQGLCLHARHSQRRTYCRLATGDRCRTPGRRTHASAAVACGPDLSAGTAA